MGDGRIALILDVAGLGVRAGVTAVQGDTKRDVKTETAEPASEQNVLMLLFRAGEFTRVAAPQARIARLERMEARRLERAGGQPVAQYRGRILPLLHLGELLAGSATWDELLYVVVVRHGNSEFGMVVDEITDIIETPILNACASGRHGLLGSATVGGQVTDLVDLDSVARAVACPELESVARLAAALAEPERDMSHEESLR
jgi:two-component system chemotaxis sensor kinase CheA